jgi:hypothetical protein
LDTLEFQNKFLNQQKLDDIQTETIRKDNKSSNNNRELYDSIENLSFTSDNKKSCVDHINKQIAKIRKQKSVQKIDNDLLEINILNISEENTNFDNECDKNTEILLGTIDEIC